MSNKYIEAGDRVRFLDEVGGGIVSRIEGNLLLVEDEDGFEIPIPISQAVLIEKKNKKEELVEEHLTEIKNVNNDVSQIKHFNDVSEENHDDFNPRLYLAFTKELDNKSDFHLHLVNDSNYYIIYLTSNIDEDGYRTAKYQGTIEPNTKFSLGSLAFHELNVSWDFQLVLFKKGKKYPNIAPVTSTVLIKPSKILKENSFAENDFFHQRAVLLPIIKNELEKKVEELSNKEFVEIVKEKEKVFQPKQYEKRSGSNEILEVDLHIHELVESTEGMTNGEMLQLQMDKFHFVMESNITNKGKKIVFIHGLGNGVLKSEIRSQLDRKYKKVNYQDASFREYGYGATMIII